MVTDDCNKNQPDPSTLNQVGKWLEACTESVLTFGIRGRLDQDAVVVELEQVSYKTSEEQLKLISSVLARARC